MSTGPLAPGSPPARWFPGGLRRKYTVLVAGLMLLVIGAFGGTEMWVSYRDARQRVEQLQAAQAQVVAGAIQGAFKNIERHVHTVTALPWTERDWFTLPLRRQEYERLLRLLPSVDSVALAVDGQRLLLVSRRSNDEVAVPPKDLGVRAGEVSPPPAMPPTPAPMVRSGRLDYEDDYEPFLTWTLSFAEAGVGGTTQVRVGLRALARELHEALSQAGSDVFAIDGDGVIVLHSNPALQVARQRVAWFDAAAAPHGGTTGSRVTAGGPGDAAVLRTTLALADPQWQVVVEQPLALAMQPVWAALRRTAVFMVLALVLALAGSFWLGEWLTRPIRQIHAAVQRLSAGDLGARVHLATGDELQALAERFNEMADRVQDSHRNLAERVAEKTRDLQAANHHKSEFLAHMSHELRTPLNAVIGFSEALKDQLFGTLNAKQMEYVQDIHASGAHLLSLINDLLDLSKIEAGRLDIDAAEFVLVDVVNSAMALVRERAIGRRQVLRLHLDDAPATWVADARRLKQVLVNLLINAVKFTPPGGHIDLTVRLAGEQGLEIDVADNGPGIPEADRAHVFEEFYQGRDQAGEHTEGTGLGLPLVKRLVELQGGAVALICEPGKGTRVRFNLPRGQV
jgi:signal transduction histidine kinase